MDGKHYKILRASLNADIKKEKKRKDYAALKLTLTMHATKFNLEDNMFDLVRAMIVGTKILEKEGFPIKEFMKFKTNGKK